MRKMSSVRGLVYHIADLALNIVIILAIVAIIRTFLIAPFEIEGSSMDTTLSNHEYIVINKFRYLVSEPVRGDIVVFRPPTDASRFYVKRVIGLPGETVVIRDGHVFLRDPERGDLQLNEPYLSPESAGQTYRFPVQNIDGTEEVFPVPDGQYFLLGDNRKGSLDSRSFAHVSTENTAFVPEENIKGSVWFVALPATKIQAFSPPEYGL